MHCGGLVVRQMNDEKVVKCDHTLSTIARILEAGLNCPNCGETASSEIRASGDSDAMPTNECDHIEGGEIPEWEQNVWVWFTYCPMCGVKL